MPVKTRRWNDPRGPSDGFRLLVCRYRPRALPKEEETWDDWWKELGPSEALHAAAYGKDGSELPWDEYERRYHGEMEAQAARIEELAARVRAGETVTLLCSASCKDAARCHRTLLRDLVEARVGPAP